MRNTPRLPLELVQRVRGATVWVLVVFSMTGLGWADEPNTPKTPGSSAPMTEEQFAARRRSRLEQLPPAPEVPAQIAAGEHPIDRFLAASWRDSEFVEATAPPSLCDDSTFARRVYLDLIGVIPTIAERDRFISDARPDKRARLIDELMARSDDYADHWTPFWEDALVSSPVGINAGMATHGNYTEWVRKAFAANKPFDLFAAELIDPTLPGHKPVEMGSDNGAPRRVHYILNQTHTDTLQSAAGVAQVFMGTAMKCASCHNHFENEEWPQRRFLAFAGMFSPTPLEVIRCEKKLGEVVLPAFPFELPGIAAELPTTADERERMHLVATMLVDPLNTRFGWSIVNRLWKRSFGLGLIEPADDFREEIEPSQPELLAWLADDFQRSGYDLKHTLRLIMTSRAYQARYDPALEDVFDTADPGAPRTFRSPILRRLTAEQLIDSMGVATTQKLDTKSRLHRQMNSTNLSRVLGKPAIRNDVSTGRSDQIAVLQGLELLNGAEFQTLTRSGSLAEQAAQSGDDAKIAEFLYRAALSRSPTPAENATVSELITVRADDKAGAVQDLLWALFASPEFQYLK